MRLIVGSVLLVAALAGCGAGDMDKKSAEAPAGESKIDANSKAESKLGNGVTRSAKPGAEGKSGDSKAEGDSKSQPDRDPKSGGVKTVRVSLLRTGGVAGVRDLVVVSGDGSWTFTSKSGEQQSGRLTKSQSSQLQSLARDPQLADEATSGGSKGFEKPCPDALRHQLDAGSVTVINDGCGKEPPRPTFSKIAELLRDHTAF
ncbi:MAG: hypothetical protein ACRDT1_03585 [Micromonosporaceae bacterium]